MVATDMASAYMRRLVNDGAEGKKDRVIDGGLIC
jgi:hypothetical protein